MVNREGNKSSMCVLEEKVSVFSTLRQMNQVFVV